MQGGGGMTKEKKQQTKLTQDRLYFGWKKNWASENGTELVTNESKNNGMSI